MTPRTHRLARVIALLAPALMLAVVAPRPLRTPGVHLPLGLALGAVFVLSIGLLVRAAHARSASARQRLQIAGALALSLPLALELTLWVGLATPWDATTAENAMRFLVLMVCSVAASVGLTLLAMALWESGARVLPTVGAAMALLAGGVYLPWTAFQAGGAVVRLRGAPLPRAIGTLSDVLDTWEFAACVLTYLATLTLAVAMRRAGWLGRKAGWACASFCVLAFVLLALRGVSYPDPTASTTPWFARPGFIVGIPAIPWIVPYLMGLAALRHAGRAPLP